MKVSIGHRLFLTVSLSMLAVAAVGVQLVRWTLFEDSAPPHAQAFERSQLDGLRDALAAQYRQRHDWSFLPVDRADRKRWLRELWMSVQQRGDAKSGAASSSLAYRIGLLDRDRHYLAGAIASRFVIVFASVDTVDLDLTVDGADVGHLLVARAQNPDDELAVAFLIDQQGNLALIAVIGVIALALVATLLAAHFRAPIRRLVAGARRLERGELRARMRLERSDELGELAGAFDHLAARLEQAERARRQWVADTSHELRTPLAVLRGQLESLQDGVRPPTQENIALMLERVAGLTRLVDELYQLARADVGQLEYDKKPCDVWPLARSTLEEFAERFHAAGLSATCGVAPARSIVKCDEQRIRQVLTNLLENCVRYTDAGGRVDVNASVAGDELRISIDDSAPAVPEQSLAHLGERFFRVDTSRSRQTGGSGLGLALCRQIVAAHAGRLEFRASPLGGLSAVLVLSLDEAR